MIIIEMITVFLNAFGLTSLINKTIKRKKANKAKNGKFFFFFAEKKNLISMKRFLQL